MCVPGKLFQPKLMFEGKARSLTEHLKVLHLGRLWPIFKHQTTLEKLAMGKHSSLLPKFVNYGRKKLYNIGSRAKALFTRPILSEDIFRWVAFLN